MKPLVSVIIPVFNGASYLAEALESVLAQDYQPLEVIVADDGSTDTSLELARSFTGVTALALQHGGVSRARNSGAAAARGEFLAFLDADDVWLPGKISAQVALAVSWPDVSFFLCQRIYKFEEVPPWFVWRADLDAPITCFEPSSWLVRRQAFEDVGPFDVGRDLGEDTNWLMRAWSVGKTHRVVPEPLLLRRIHGSNASAALPSTEAQVMGLLREFLAMKRAAAREAERPTPSTSGKPTL